MTDTMRIRLSRLPSARELEYMALRFVKSDGVYDVPLPFAFLLMDLECASRAELSDALTDFIDLLPDDDGEA